jgi:hypothetical protein
MIALASVALCLRPPTRQFESPVDVSEDIVAPEMSMLVPELKVRVPVCKFEAENTNPGCRLFPPDVVARMTSFESAEVVLN